MKFIKNMQDWYYYHYFNLKYEKMKAQKSSLICLGWHTQWLKKPELELRLTLSPVVFPVYYDILYGLNDHKTCTLTEIRAAGWRLGSGNSVSQKNREENKVKSGRLRTTIECGHEEWGGGGATYYRVKENEDRTPVTSLTTETINNSWNSDDLQWWPQI